MARAVVSSADDTAALHACSSGVELTLRGWASDIDIAAERDADTSVPVLRDGVFHDRSTGA